MMLKETEPRIAAIESLHSRTAIYTRDPVVSQLLDVVHWPDANRRLVDTSCGDGAFLGAALERLLSGVHGIDDSQVAELIEGWEIHPRAVDDARARLTSILVRHGRADSQATSMAHHIVHAGDFLTQAPGNARYDTVVGNPPYLRMVHVPTLLREDYQAILPGYAKQDLLHSFLDKCATCLRPGGEIAMVTADRWLFNVAAAGLREAIGSRLGIHHLERLDPVSTFYRPKYRRAGTPPRVHPIAIVLRSRELCKLPLGRQPIFPGEETALAGTRTLADIATVQLGPWLGTKGVFVVDAQTAASLPSEHLVPVVDSRDLAAGITAPRQFAVRTGASEPVPCVMEHLRRTMHLMCKRGRRTQTWLPPESFDSFDLQSKCLVVPRIASGLKAYRVKAGWLPINYNLVIRPLPGYTLEEVEGAIAADQAQTWIRHRAHKLESGYLQVSANLLRALPC